MGEDAGGESVVPLEEAGEAGEEAERCRVQTRTKPPAQAVTAGNQR
jgi:hypothetical protein